MVTDPSWYRGKRALILTRVSTDLQKKNYSHAAQERKARTELVAAFCCLVVIPPMLLANRSQRTTLQSPAVRHTMEVTAETPIVP